MRLTLITLLVLASCGGDSALGPTVTTGVWGEAQRPCDQIGCVGKPIAGTAIEAFATGSATSLASATADDDGAFDLALPPGTYDLCANGAAEPDAYNCTMVTTTAALPLLRADWIDTMGWYNCNAEDC